MKILFCQHRASNEVVKSSIIIDFLVARRSTCDLENLNTALYSYTYSDIYSLKLNEAGEGS